MNAPSMLYEILSEKFNDIIDKESSSQLWSGCGCVNRMCLDGMDVVVKFAQVPTQLIHRNIVQTDFALARKLKSYQIELAFYQQQAARLDGVCLVPKPIHAVQRDCTTCLVLSDFSGDGFRAESDPCTEHHHQVLTWLADFHSYFMIQNDIGWQEGGYWHLATRPDEFQRMAHSELKTHANSIAALIRDCPYRTQIHGDAKIANFVFNSELAVLGYDFQYLGSGLGIQDVMLYFTSVFDNDGLYTHADELLEYYFVKLADNLITKHSMQNSRDIVSCWRELWPVVWSDFHRFLLGWKPDHFKINDYMCEQSQNTLRLVRG
ncbi:aminoglycoside phosphotransferase family protein [Pseudoalteromonas sp. MMG022]|uniref:aminoglycoside phosphotransferase family protein n=1 Tax=Pseudoalteromonas sp. MMG022 TaxID=2909978 RepID=UPI001F18169E|nr:aminoglycoside phosphotransferase family protein [Pseudoalteromonas sp. MMG022]MCF6434327.1 aminoglycoside phosphotransferase family protein [Pseudoalteromonas sp. MMG022]